MAFSSSASTRHGKGRSAGMVPARASFFWATEEIRAKRLRKGSWPLLREAALAGEYPRGRATELTGYEERQARNVLSQLMGMDLLVSSTRRGSVPLGFPIGVVERWFPRLYPGLG